MAQSSSTREPVDLGILEQNFEAAQTSFDLSELIAQTLIGIAGYSKSAAGHLGTLAANRHDTMAISQVAEQPWTINVAAGSFAGMTAAIQANAHLLSATLAVQLRSVTEQLSAINETLRCLHRTGEETAKSSHTVAGSLHRIASAFECGVKLDRDDATGLLGTASSEIIERRLQEIRRELAGLIEEACAERCRGLEAQHAALASKLAEIERTAQQSAEDATPQEGGSRPDGTSRKR